MILEFEYKQIEYTKLNRITPISHVSSCKPLALEVHLQLGLPPAHEAACMYIKCSSVVVIGHVRTVQS